MRILISANSVTLEVSEVSLDDGCIPAIGNYQHQGQGENGGESLEPAIWFKVLVIDSISINCAQRAVYWNSISNVRQQFENKDSGIESTYYPETDGGNLDDVKTLSRRISESVFTMGDCLGYDHDLEEVFDSLPLLVQNYQKNVLEKNEFYENLMRLLHLYILPSIKLSTDDISVVADCLVNQEKCLEKLNQEITLKTDSLQEVKKAKNRQRQKFIEELVSLKKMPSYSKEFMDALEIELAVDRKNLAEQMKMIEKQFLEMSNITPEKIREKDEVVRNYNNIKLAQEKLDELKRKSGIKKIIQNRSASSIEIQMWNVYLGMIDTEKSIRSLTRILFNKKVLMLSVKEAINTVLNELKKGEETFGLDVDSTSGVKSTDVLGTAIISRSWQTLTEQVSGILSDENNRVTIYHHQFCSDVIERIKGALEEKCFIDTFNSNRPEVSRVESGYSINSIYSSSSVSSFPFKEYEHVTLDNKNSFMLVESLSSTNVNSLENSLTSYVSSNNSDCVVATEDKQKKSGDLGRKKPWKKSRRSNGSRNLISVPSFQSYEAPVLVFEENGNYIQKAIEHLQKFISDQSEVICRLIQKELNLEGNERCYKKIWLNYENYFYPETMDLLIQLYKMEYKNVTDALYESVQSITIQDLGLEDALLCHMLQDLEDLDVTMCTSPSGLHAGGDGSDGSVLMRKKSNERNSHVPSHSSEQHSVDSFDENADDDPNIALLRKHFSDASQSRQTVRMSLTIDYPTSSVIVYERTLSPIRKSFIPSSDCSSNISEAGNSNLSNLPETVLRRTLNKSIVLKPKYREKFSVTFGCITNALCAKTPSTKLHHLTKCLREATNQIYNFYQELYNRPVRACADELMDILVIILCNLGLDLLQLYTQIKILTDMLPTVYIGGPFDFTLVQFAGACQFLQEKTMMKRNRKPSPLPPNETSAQAEIPQIPSEGVDQKATLQLTRGKSNQRSDPQLPLESTV